MGLRNKLKVGITMKLAVIVFVSLTLLNLYACVFALPQMQNKFLQERKSKAREEVQTAHSAMQHYYGLEMTGTLTTTEAQAYTLQVINGLTYGEDAPSYFWVTDYQPVLLADPAMQDRVGTELSDVRDAEGRPIYLDLVNICSTSSEGFYDYVWIDPGADAAARRTAYVKAFEPWNWTVGTSVSTEDIHSLSGWNKYTLGTLSGITALLIVGLFIIVTRLVIIRPLASMVKTSEALAEGDVDQKVEVRSNDEIGALATAYSKLINYMKEMAGATEKLASGDLSAEITPRSERDVLAKSFVRMVENQRDLIGKVKNAALGVAQASKQLSRASEQTAQATQQIASTIQQVAKGASEQSISLQETTRNMEHLSKAIDQISSGAQEQSSGLEEATQVVGQVSAAINQVTTNSRIGAEAWTSTATSAEKGARMTHETVEGMEKIRKAMEMVSARVTDLGERSNEIGKIVATIDDIAAQTNLLALNAAIEAARAGEQGRGFAVVADEVRKLAERSSVATKEIANLVGGIQSGVREAVAAMGQGTQEIESGYRLATDAGEALDDILARAKDVGKQVDEISSAAQELNSLSINMVKVIERINRIVEENVSATQQMTHNSVQVSGSIQDLNGVAEENSAATEEVSASAEEMSAQIQEVLASAQSLTDMSEELENSVSVFRVEQETSHPD